MGATLRRPPLPSQDEVVEAFLARSKRGGSVPIRNAFVQGGQQASPAPGPLAGLVRRHDERALDLKLLHQCVAVGGGHDVTAAAVTWARALGLYHPNQGPAAVSKVWHRLADAGLVRKERSGRLAEVTLLKEDGSGAPYTHPYRARERYFKVPFEYWTADERWYRTLSLPAKAVLLIALSLRTEFYLPVEKAKEWYGISRDTAETGLRELRKKGLLAVDVKYVPAPLSPLGYTERRLYRLAPPFRTSYDRVRRLRTVPA